MARYFEGHAEARAAIYKMSKEELLDYLATMQGVGDAGPDTFSLRAEALSQCDQDFKQAETADDIYYRELVTAMRRGQR